MMLLHHALHILDAPVLYHNYVVHVFLINDNPMAN